jgi:hypothetical protein
MAPRLHVSAPQRQERTNNERAVRERTFNMRSLRRLVIWGLAASLALGAAVAAGYSETGLRRLMADGNDAPARKADAAPAPAAARPPEAEAEARRLADAVRALAADREQLGGRVAALERNLDDLTGSIKRQNGSPAAEGTPAAGPAVAATASTDPPPAAPTPTPARATDQTPVPAQRTIAATAPKPEEVPAPAKPAELKPEFGVDVGGAINFVGLRVLWTSTKGRQATLFEGLHPQVVTRENNRTKSAELRLVVGPLPSIEAAAGICTALTAVRRYCQPVAFEGQRLADVDAAPEPKAEATRERKTAAKPRPVAPALKPPRLFQ